MNKNNNPFDDNYFVGYVNEVNSQAVKIHFPSSSLLGKFYHKEAYYSGGHVGSFVVIEGDVYGFLARIIDVSLPESERKAISEKAILHDDTNFHPSGHAEILLSFSIFDRSKIQKTISHYPVIGARVYACSDQQIGDYVKEFGKKDGMESIYANLGKLTANNADCNVSLNALFGRHCAVVGTTGGGKSWTVAKLIESVIGSSSNKVILIDATGEYKGMEDKDTILAVDSYFSYRKLNIPDLFFLLRPTGQSQRPVLLEAIRTLKMVALDQANSLGSTGGILPKEGKLKSPYVNFYQTNISEIENNKCNFDITKLAQQIKNECIYPSGFNDISKFGGADLKTYDYQTSLISRINDLINSDTFNSLFSFSNVAETREDITKTIGDFLLSDSERVLRISFEEIYSVFAAKEILANALATFLLGKAKKDKFFAPNPLLLILDEAHQFLNKNVKDEFFESQSLDAFDIIAKECRKYGLFLCLATQMPRDIPTGTLSQMGTFIVHRLINEQDKKAIENACSSANKSALSFLPVLGEGEALMVGVDFPMPLTLKITPPNRPPKSNTPTFSPLKKEGN